MNNPQQIKELLKPTIVAQHYLGQPKKITRNKLWYKSPFRNERTASFMVDNTAFHDFGDNWHGDVIDFVERYYSVDFITSMKILTRDFGLPESEKISKELEEYLVKKQREEIEIKRKLDSWFNNTFNNLCNELHMWKKAIPHLKGEALAIAYSMEQKLDYLTELFINATEDDKIALWKDR